MVLHAPNDDWLTIEVEQNSTKVTIRFVAKRFVSEEEAAVFGGENGVNQNLRR